MTMNFCAAHRLNYGFLFLSMTLSCGALHAQGVDAAREPLAANFDSYNAAAKRGDLAVASKLFKEASECLAMRRIDERMSSRLSDRHSILNDRDRQGGSEDKTLVEMKGAQQRADASRTMCEGTKNIISNENIYDMALTAAKLGDTAASACFIAAPWPVENKDVDLSKARQYRDEAEILGESAIKKGNWRVVQAMASAASGFGNGGYSSYIYKQDFVAQLRYEKLLRLGATPDRDEAKNLDLAIQILSSRVSSADIATADEWAHKIYTKFYSTVPLPAQSTACGA
jgi:hypothetical protein